MRYSKMILLAAAVFTLLCPCRAYGEQNSHTPVIGEVEVTCPQEEGRFLLTAQGDAPHADEDTIKVTQAGKGHFACRFLEPGDYAYKLTQVHMDQDGITYDKSEYEILFQVTTDDAGVLSSSTQIMKKGDDDKYQAAAFTNVKHKRETRGTGEGNGEKHGEEKGSSPKTGDLTYGTAVYLALLAAGIPAVIWLVVRKRGDRGER